MEKIGPPGASFIAIPVALAGVYFGATAGLAAGLFGVVLNTVLLTGFEGGNWFTSIINYWPAILLVLAAGYSSGRLGVVSAERKQVLNNLRSRERYLTLLKMTTSDILNVINPGEKYYFLLTHLVNLFIADYGYFVRWDASQDKAIFITSTTQSEQPISANVMESAVSAIIESAMRTGRILAIDDLQNSQYIINSTFSKEFTFQARSALAIPFLEKGYKLAIVVLAFNTLRQFTPEEMEQAQQASNQIALVLWSVQQDIEIQKRLKETRAIARIGRALSETERVGLSTVLQLIVSSAKELIPATEQAVIHLLDDEQQTLTAEAVIGYTGETTNPKIIKIRLNEGVAGQTIVSGETINIADVRTDPRFLVYGELPSYRSLMVAPVQSGERKLGTISVQSNLVGAFTQEESRLLSALGTQATIAIENAHLLESTQQALKESNALHRINQGLVASLDPQELLQDVVELLKTNFGYYHVQIYIAEPETGDFIMRAGSGEIGRQLLEQGYRLRAGEGIVGYTAETESPFFTNDVDRLFSFVRNPLLPDTKSELAVPVKIDGRIVGLLDIQHVPPGYLTQRDIHLVSAVADQLAVALQKANLYSDLQNALKMEKSIRSQMVQGERLAVMGRLLASVSHELNNPLQAIQNALYLLREEIGISSQGKQDLDIVLSEAERMSALINRLRTTYRPAQIEDFKPTQINNIIEDVYALIATHLRHNEISFEFYPDPTLPEILGLTDQIRQVMLNLMMNAVEAMTTGGRLNVSTQCLKDSEEVLIEVSDSGVGINSAILPNIFDAFVTDKERGTGLGLTITYDIITKHGGRIQAKNNVQHGATFSVWLPCGIKVTE